MLRRRRTPPLSLDCPLTVETSILDSPFLLEVTLTSSGSVAERTSVIVVSRRLVMTTMFTRSISRSRQTPLAAFLQLGRSDICLLNRNPLKKAPSHLTVLPFSTFRTMAPIKEAVLTDKAPLALGGKVFNQAIKANGFVFCSGQIAQDPSGKVIEGDVKAHTV
jgi:hypothetical protein